MSEAHLRIDEGIKRGPKGMRRSVPRRRDPETGQVQAIPPGLNPAEVLQRYLTEQTTSQIAQSYGVTRKSLVAWLRQVAPKEWEAVQLVRAHDRKEKGNEGLEDAQDALSLARARELVKSAQWELQALDPAYRPKQDIQIEHVGDLGDRLRRARERVIDAEPQTPEKPIEST